MLIPEEYGQVNWKFGGTGLPTGAECTMGFFHGEIAGTPQDAAIALYDIWQDRMIPLQCDELSLLSCLVKFGPNDTGNQFEQVATTAGAATGEFSTPATAVLVTKQTIIGGRKGRGRMYVPGLPEADLLPGGVIPGPTVDAWNAALSDLLDDMEAAGLFPRLLHGVYDPQPDPYNILAMTASNKAATQRRRQRR